MKEIRFLGDSENCIRKFPRTVMIRTLHEFDRLRHGLNPTDWRPMTSVGIGVREIRIRCRSAFRVIYIASMPEVIYVLHAFRKRSARTRKQDIELARKRFRDL